MEFSHEMIVCIVNAGFSDTVMAAAKAAGATGGTVIKARGTASVEAEKYYNITISPEKEMVMILVTSEKKNDILHAVYQSAGLNTDGNGIAFALPVDEVVGLSERHPEEKAQ